MGNNQKVVFLNSSANYAPYRKRITAIKNMNIQVEELAFTRDRNLGKKYNVDFTHLGIIRNGHYIERIKTFFSVCPKIRNSIGGAHAVYAFGFDMLLLAIIASFYLRHKPKIIYEVHDIRDIFMDKGIIGGVARTLEKITMNNVYLLIVTSKLYVTEYYEAILKLRNIRYLVFENKLDKDRLKKNIVPPKSYTKPLKIGYFGSLRCIYAWMVLKLIVQKSNGEIEVYIRGVPNNLKNFEEDIRKIDGIKYGGGYLDPEDLPDIYSQVDIVWGASFDSKISYNWSRRCRFYNACYFQRPIICLKETEDGRIVEDLGIGFCVDLKNIEETVKSVLSISQEEIKRWQGNIIKLPRDIYTYTDEYNYLIEEIQRN